MIIDKEEDEFPLFIDTCPEFYATKVKDCPMCHKGIISQCIYVVQVLEPSKFENTELNNSVGLFRCPSCGSIFLVHLSTYDDDESNAIYTIDYAYPNTPSDNRKFNSDIEDISPGFVEIYRQAETAEAHNLYQIAGIGYRKAFEFLIKDYACTLYPDEQDSIKSDWLSKVIKEKIDNPILKEVVERINWIGTDHGHYYQKYDDYNINDLKTFINATLSWILLLKDTERIQAITKR